MVNGILYDRTGGRLEASDERTGEMLWSWQDAAAVVSEFFFKKLENTLLKIPVVGGPFLRPFFGSKLRQRLSHLIAVTEKAGMVMRPVESVASAIGMILIRSGLAE